MKRILILCALLGACSNDWASRPSEVDDGPVVTTTVSSPSGPSGTAGLVPTGGSDDAPPVGDCAVVGLDRKAVRYRVEDLTLHIYAPSETAHYVDVWTPEVNGTKLGRILVNQWDSVTLPSYGTYRIKLAAERVENGTIQQCDRHWFEVEASPPPPGCAGDCTPPPPPCQADCGPPPPPPCDLPVVGTTISWTGPGDPQTECEAFGLSAGSPPDSLICKAGNDRTIVPLDHSGPTCPNGKKASHFTPCVCPVEN